MKKPPNIWIGSAMAANAMTLLIIFFSPLPWMWPGEFNDWLAHYAFSQISIYIIWVLMLTVGLAGLFSKSIKWRLAGGALMIILLTIFFLNSSCLLGGTECGDFFVKNLLPK